jgi:hypothetical protein
LSYANRVTAEGIVRLLCSPRTNRGARTCAAPFPPADRGPFGTACGASTSGPRRGHWTTYPRSRDGSRPARATGSSSPSCPSGCRSRPPRRSRTGSSSSCRTSSTDPSPRTPERRVPLGQPGPRSLRC